MATRVLLQVYESDSDDEGMSDGELEYRRDLEEDEETGYDSSGDGSELVVKRSSGSLQLHLEEAKVDLPETGLATSMPQGQQQVREAPVQRIWRYGLETPRSPQYSPESLQPVRMASEIDVQMTGSVEQMEKKISDKVLQHGVDTPWSPVYSPMPQSQTKGDMPADAGAPMKVNAGMDDTSSLLPPPLLQLTAPPFQQSSLSLNGVVSSTSTLSLPVRPAPTSTPDDSTSSNVLAGQKRKLEGGGEVERVGDLKRDRMIKRPRGQQAAAQLYGKKV